MEVYGEVSGDVGSLALGDVGSEERRVAIGPEYGAELLEVADGRADRVCDRLLLLLGLDGEDVDDGELLDELGLLLEVEEDDEVRVPVAAGVVVVPGATGPPRAMRDGLGSQTDDGSPGITRRGG